MIVVPIAEQRGKARLHFADREIAVDSHDDIRGKVIAPVEIDQILAMDAVDVFIVDVPTVGIVAAVDYGGEFARKNSIGIVVAPRNRAAELHLGKIHFFLPELGRGHQVAKHGHDLGGVFLQT